MTSGSTSVLVWTSETTVPPACPPPDLTTTYVRCRTCFYDKPIGQRCGLPCL